MLTATLLMLGGVVLALALVERPVQLLPLSPALIYLVVGALAGVLLGAPSPQLLQQHAQALTFALELAVLLSLFAVGVRLPVRWRVQPGLHAWRLALLLAGPVMVLSIVLATLAGYALLHLPWAAALLLASILAPTDPVLASDVQIRSGHDRDTVRLALTAEGGLNDGSALPAVMLALGLMDLHPLGGHGALWWWADLAWPIAGGAAIGAALGWLLGWALRLRARHGDPLARDELIYAGALLLALGLARATATSSFVLVFIAAVTLLLPLRGDVQTGIASAASPTPQGLASRLHAFGSRCERLVEATTVLAVGVMLSGVRITVAYVLFALLMAVLVRPLAVLAFVRRSRVPPTQRRLIAWFGIRGIGSLFYLLFVLEHGVADDLAGQLAGATLVCVAVSIVLHGVSATPLMARYHQRRNGQRPPPQ